MGKDQPIDWPSLKTLDKGAKEFTANGREYRIYPNMSFDRWRDMQKMEVELSFGVGMAQMVEKLQEQKKSLNKLDFVDASLINRDLILGVASLNDNRWPAVLRICTLFVNYKGEDITKIDEQTIAEKINDWKVEGYDMGSFFQLALGAIPGFLSAYQNATQSSSQKEVEKSEALMNNE